MLFAPYRSLLRLPHARRLVVASVLGRIPIGISSLAIVLLVRRSTGSFADAGAVAATFALCSAAFAPVQGRLVDRLGQTRVLLATAVVHAAGLCALVAGAAAAAPPACSPSSPAWRARLSRPSRRACGASGR